MSQLARQICTKLPVLRFVHLRRVRKIVANLKVNFRRFYANAPFPMPFLQILRVRMALVLRKTAHFLGETEILGVGVCSPLPTTPGVMEDFYIFFSARDPTWWVPF